MFEIALFNWQEGERRVRQAPADQRPVLERVTERLVDELRRRLGSTFTSEELARLYGEGTDWCLPVAAAIAPDAPWAWESETVADAAFARYVRDAVDYAGGRRL
ncbi:MAG: hypothetical protein QOI98_316 [Solirubrobacteraceae bacterium]|nr:hypothetical protein [Solirubrobacteraceae bacterium]